MKDTVQDIVLSKPGARRYKPHPLEKSKKYSTRYVCAHHQ
jgi:hypothetical protein